MKLKADNYFLIIILVGMIVLLYTSLNMEHWEAKVLPIMISLMILSLGIFQLVKDLRSNDQITRKEEKSKADKKVRLVRMLSAMGWITGSAISCYVFGFLLTILLFMVPYLKLKKRSWMVTIVTTIGTAVSIYIIFEYLMGFELYRGVIYKAIQS